MEDTKEQIKSMTDEAISVTLETAKNLGIKGINEFISLNANDLSFSTGNVKDNKLKKYQTIDVSQTILEDILTGKIRKIETLRNCVENQNKIDRDNVLNGKTQVYTSSLKYLVLYRRENDDRINDFVNIIETIFLK